jgi:Flp pilus assembly protein TadB
MAERLKSREDAEEKIRSILAAGSGYARLTIIVFSFLFIPMIFLFREQFNLLLEPNLKPIFLFLVFWTFLGIMTVSRITSMEFTRHYALRPNIKQFMKEKKWTLEELLTYSGLQWSRERRQILTYAPLILGFGIAYCISLYNASPLIILIGFAVAVLILRIGIEFILKGLVEDQLIKLIETFPELLQIFIIGLNTGLNTYLAFQFAQEAVKDFSPRLLRQELFRTKFAMECGESHTRTWERFAEMLPFETVIDFCEIMVIAPMHGESIVQSIVQMTNSYQEKKLTLMEKKATSIGQIVIAFIVVAFLPLFLFVVFAPTILKINASINN